MKSVEVLIRGTEPLLMHRFADPQEVEESTRKVMVKRGTPQEQAEKATYRDEKGEFYLPGAAIARLIRDAAGNHKLRGTRRSARYLVPSAVRMKSERIPLTNGDGKTPLTHYIVDSRSIVIPATKGRIMAYRPRFNQWSLRFGLRINETLLECDFVKKLLVEGGEQLGLGAFRAEKGGTFGLFEVVEWAEVK